MTTGTVAMETREKLLKIFRYALNQEKTGLSFFQTSLDRLETAAAVTAFKKLIDEEKKHILFIGNLINDLEEGGEVRADSLQSVAIPPSDFFDERAKSDFLEQCMQRSEFPDVTVFNTALLIERDLHQFYGNMAEMIEESMPRNAFKMLADWEKGHERFFQKIRDELMKEYEAMPWNG